MFVSVNGRLLPAAAATISVFDRAFAYGDALFETIKVREGRPVFFNEHFQRLTEGIEAAGFNAAPAGAEVRRRCLELAAANSVESGRLRLQLSRGAPDPEGASGFDPAPGLKPTLVIICQGFPGYPQELYRDGIDCITVPLNRGRHASLKSTGLLPLVLARRQMHAAGAGEALLTAADGRLLEGTFTNIFFRDGGRLCTPPDDLPILPGIIRGKVMEIAAGLDMPLDLKALRPGDIEPGATAAFLTSSLLGVCPVRSIDGAGLRLDTDTASGLAARLEEMEKEDVRAF